MTYEDEIVVDLDEEVMETITKKLEESINEVLGELDKDARLELLVSLGLITAQVAIDNFYEKEDYLELSEELFNDVKESVEELDEEEVDEKERYSIN